MLEACKERGLLTARARRRTDSTHVLAATRDLNRLELVGETLRAALNTLAAVAPGWLRQQAPSEWFDRYAARVEGDAAAQGPGGPLRAWNEITVQLLAATYNGLSDQAGPPILRVAAEKEQPSSPVPLGTSPTPSTSSTAGDRGCARRQAWRRQRRSMSTGSRTGSGASRVRRRGGRQSYGWWPDPNSSRASFAIGTPSSTSGIEPWAARSTGSPSRRQLDRIG
jgi:hypothetical protein